MADLDDVIDRLRTLVEELKEASEDGRWYIVEDVIEELEGVIARPIAGSPTEEGIEVR
jgi:hypothetical protein